jgi:hypothetical protein
MLRITGPILAAILLFPLVCFAASPYVGQTSRTIKALSDQEVADYVSGKGMGLAKAAELNGYPGPAHVLELADQLQLSATQRKETEAIFLRMQTSAIEAGKRLVDQERKLDQLFASKAISPLLLRQAVDSIASLQGDVREIHLKAHLEQVDVLNADQIERYWHLRGYASGDAVQHHSH